MNIVMENSRLILRKLFSKYWPIIVIIFVVLVFFYPIYLKGLIPLPIDFIVGTYYPWLEGVC